MEYSDVIISPRASTIRLAWAMVASAVGYLIATRVEISAAASAVVSGRASAVASLGRWGYFAPLTIYLGAMLSILAICARGATRTPAPPKGRVLRSVALGILGGIGCSAVAAPLLAWIIHEVTQKRLEKSNGML